MALPFRLSCMALLAAAMVSSSPLHAELLPLAKGNYWIYRGPTKWIEPSANGKEGKVHEEILTWRMEITDVIRRGDDLTAAVVEGFPGDLAWYEPGKKPGDHLIVRVGAGAYHLLSGDEARQALKQFRGRKKPRLKDIVGGETLLIDAPLTEGKHYGPADELKRNMYCWVVGSPEAFSGEGIKGLPKPAPRESYPVDFLTNPDGTHIRVVPGVGIVAYQYDHHGTISETDLQLIEVHLEKP